MSRPIRVLHIIGGGEIGGAEIHILDLARHFSPQEVELRLCCLFPAPLLQRAQKQGILATAVPMRSKVDLIGFWKVLRLIRQTQPAIVHTHGVRANLIGRLAAKVAGVRCTVTTVHSVLANDYPDQLSRWINFWSEKLTAALTERYIVVADFLKKNLCEQGIAPAKITVIHNGVDDEKYTNVQDKRDLRAELGIAADAPLVGMVGRFHPVKGHKYLIEAAKEILKINSNVRFLLVGDGFHRDVIETVIREEGLESCFLFTGFREDIADIYRTLDVLALPSLSEGLSLTLMESMLCECPAVVTAVGGNPEIVINEKNGLVVPSGDALALAAALVRLIENREEARKFGEAARRTIEERFTARRMAERTQNLYRELVKDQ
ncbi:glycosyltransferase [Heliobacterium gestii]|uniref:Glycosyltransferase n=1 Tax=Heliomicrobium gestii TaxID=2699 RepID=A0A845L8L0_HELGE|nr:glycosyltransferase [Heliomicrobium gestii]MBM7866643.1 glycosyltransferase involved in cell wall biosynthesis [Heliomicrobium gestii]MZP43077.1 glycosyltransferase [Heliomicrobium gestii]